MFLSKVVDTAKNETAKLYTGSFRVPDFEDVLNVCISGVISKVYPRVNRKGKTSQMKMRTDSCKNKSTLCNYSANIFGSNTNCN